MGGEGEAGRVCGSTEKPEKRVICVTWELRAALWVSFLFYLVCRSQCVLVSNWVQGRSGVRNVRCENRGCPKQWPQGFADLEPEDGRDGSEGNLGAPSSV